MDCKDPKIRVTAGKFTFDNLSPSTNTTVEVIIMNNEGKTSRETKQIKTKEAGRKQFTRPYCVQRPGARPTTSV